MPKTPKNPEIGMKNHSNFMPILNTKVAGLMQGENIGILLLSFFYLERDRKKRNC